MGGVCVFIEYFISWQVCMYDCRKESINQRRRANLPAAGAQRHAKNASFNNTEGCALIKVMLSGMRENICSAPLVASALVQSTDSLTTPRAYLFGFYWKTNSRRKRNRKRTRLSRNPFDSEHFAIYGRSSIHGSLFLKDGK